MDRLFYVRGLDISRSGPLLLRPAAWTDGQGTKRSQGLQPAASKSIFFLLKPTTLPFAIWVPVRAALSHPKHQLRVMVRALSALGILILATTHNAHGISSHRPPPHRPPPPHRFLAGIGIRDITGPIAEQGMMGYGRFGQKTEGIQTRLWSRALVLQEIGADSPPRGNPKKSPVESNVAPVAIVVTDLLMIPLGARLLVLKKLDQVLPGRFTESSIMILPNHTHSGPGGYSHYTLYNLSMLGFDWQHYNQLAQGIADSILMAYQDREEVTLKLNRGNLRDISANRSLVAYQANKDAAHFSENIDTLMTLIRVDRVDGSPKAAINWFAIHATSVPPSNYLVSGDNKGIAALQLEKRYNGTTNDFKGPHSPRFLALFANSNEGDVTPNVWGTEESEPFEFARRSAEAQAKFAISLFESAKETITGPIQTIHRWVRMPGRVVPKEWVPEDELRTDHRLCRAAMGYSFAAGAEDGPSNFPGLTEGLTQDYLAQNLRLADFPLMLALMLVFKHDEFDHACQYPKPIFMPAGYQTPPWTPDVIPFQLIRIGPLVIFGLPSEPTTMAGRRLRAQLERSLQEQGVQQAVIGGLANGYSGYLTTYEEYLLQHYEGGATAYGPLTFSMYQAIADELAEDLGRESNATSEQAPKTDDTPPWNFQTGVVFDGKRPWQSFGAVLTPPPERVAAGQTVSVSFRSGHPRNRYLEVKSFLEVQQLQSDASWRTLVYDWSGDTWFRWYRPLDPTCLACSILEANWRIPADTLPGKYRIVHSGFHKPVGARLPRPYQGFSPTFEVTAPKPQSPGATK